MSRLDDYQKRLASGECATEIMNDMEKKFNIPIINNEEYNKNNLDVIELYREISNSRNFSEK